MIRNASDQALFELGEALKQLGYRHVTVTPATHARVNSRPGNEWATNLAGVFGWSRRFQAAILPDRIFELMQQAGIVERCPGGRRSLLRASTLNDHLYFHSAWPTDAHDAVFFGPDTYRYVSAISRRLPTLQTACEGRPAAPRAVDIGCGAGPGAVALALQLPTAQVLAVDINDHAMRLSRVNAALAGVAIEVQKSNILADVDGDFDLIVANPPYLPDPAARAYRHGGGPLGADLSLEILRTSLPRLRPDGALLLYTGSAMVHGTDLFRAEAAKLLRKPYAWTYEEIDPDIFGEELDAEPLAHVDRIAAVVLCCRAPPANPGR